MPRETSLVWDSVGRPFSSTFNDIYFSQAGGLEESRYVFLEGNSLPDAWEGKETFVIGELGFGTGLNLLAVWEMLLTCKAPPTKLCYVSLEAYPLKREDIVRAHQAHPSLLPLAKRLCGAYPDAFKTLHALQFESLHVTLVFEEAKRALAHFPEHVDAWFLDGFAPSKNPEMWEEELLSAVATRSHAGTTLATFTAASHVRRTLTQLGFSVEKRKGFGTKREMSIGRY